MSIIVSLIIYLIVLGLIYWLVMMLPLPAPFGLIIRILFVLCIFQPIVDGVSG